MEQPPQPSPWGVSDDEAVELCRKWMTYLGAPDTVAAMTTTTHDFDLSSANYIGWVVNHSGNLDVDAVERASAVGAAQGRAPIIFIRRGVRPAARQKADESGVALLRFDPQSGSIDGGNSIGRDLCESGLASK